MTPMAAVNMPGLLDAEPASRKDMFMNAPKKAAMPVNAPNRSPRPTAISPKTMTYPNQLWASLAIRTLRNSRYHSNVMAGRAGASGMAAERCQYARSDEPPSSHPVPAKSGFPFGLRLCQTAFHHAEARKHRRG